MFDQIEMMKRIKSLVFSPSAERTDVNILPTIELNNSNHVWRLPAH